MEINFAQVSDASIIHDLMIKAFMEYRDVKPPSSALEETPQSVSTALELGEQALIAFIENKPVGMVRFKQTNESLYFSRLSVIPEKQKHGIAKDLIKSLEDYANNIGLTIIKCKVRMTVSKNIKLYRSLGFRVCDEEVVNKPNGTVIRVITMKKEL